MRSELPPSTTMPPSEHRSDEKAATEDINHLTKTMQVVRIKMSEQGITDKFDEFEEEKRRVKKAK
jgi:hypothetical protein